MKRGIAIAIVLTATGLVALGATFGPDLYAYVKVEDAIEQHTTAYTVNGGPWPQLQDSCALCHGAKGQAKNAEYASLAGQPASYIESQLHAFAEGRRKNPYMAPLAASLSSEKIAMLGAYYARQPAEISESHPVDKVLVERGKKVVAKSSCTSCHGGNLMGTAIAPRLAGQGEFYLVDQLVAFQKKTRVDPTQAMNSLIASLSDSDLKAVANYLANLNPENVSAK